MLHSPSGNDGLRTPDDSIREFVARAQRGSLDAFSHIVQRMQDRLFNFMRQRVGSEQDAEDLTQETFLRAWREIARYDHRYAFSTWLFTIGSRLAIDRSRRPQLPTSASSGGAGDRDAGDLDLQPCTQAGPDHASAVRDAHANLWEIAQHALSDTQRAALWLRHAEDLPPATIARVLGMSAVNVRVTLHRAQLQLLEHVQQREARTRSAARMVGQGAATLPVAMITPTGRSTTVGFGT